MAVCVIVTKLIPTAYRGDTGRSKFNVLTESEILRTLSNLNVNVRGDVRAPHKPLLALLAIGRWEAGSPQVLLADIEDKLKELLVAFGPPTKQQQPELPYWHLQGDGIWRVEDAGDLPRQKGGFPMLAGLRNAHGSFSDDVQHALLNETFRKECIQTLLDNYFPESLHEDILGSVGIERTSVVSRDRRKRDPRFRDLVLQAYDYRCAATGFQAALSGSYFGCEAAHMRWHAYDGPDTLDNGLCLEPTMHKLLDRGAWSLTDDRRVLISKSFTGSDAAIERVRSLHGKPISAPSPGEPELSVEFIRWHRESRLGGVFRGPSLTL